MRIDPRSSSAETLPQQYRVLLEIADAITAYQDVTSLLKDLAARLQHVVEADGMNIVLYDEERHTMRLHSLASAVLPQIELIPELPIEDAPAGWVWENQQPLLMNDLDQLKARYPKIVAEIRAFGIQCGYALPLTSAGRRLGVLGFGSRRANAYGPAEQEFLQQVAKLVAVALDNTLNFASARKAEAEAKRRSEELQLLLEINNAVVSTLDLRELLNGISPFLRRVVHHDFAAVLVHDPTTDQLRAHALDLPEGALTDDGVTFSLEGTPSGLAFRTRQPVLVTREMLDQFGTTPLIKLLQAQGVQSGCSLPLLSHDRALGVLTVMSLRADHFSQPEVGLLAQIASQIAIAVENSLNYERTRQAEQELARKLEHLRLMLKITNAVVSQLDLQELLLIISRSIREALGTDLGGVALFDHESNQLRAFATDVPAGHPLREKGLPIPLVGSPSGLAFTSGQPVFMDKPDFERFTTDLYRRIVADGYGSGCRIPLIAQGRKLGILSVDSRGENAFSADAKELLCQVANQIAIAVDNALNFERARKAEQEVKRQLERERLMLELNNAVVTQLDLRALARVTATRLREVLQHDITGISLYDEATQQFRAYMFDLPANLPPVPEGTLMPLEGTIGGLAFHSGRPVFLERYDAEFLASEFDRRLMEAGVRSGGVVPLIAHDKKLGFLGVGSFRENAFSSADQDLLCHIANQIAMAVENALNFERAHIAEQQAKHQTEQTQLLLQVNNAIASALDLPSLFRAVSDCLRQVFKHDYAVMGLYNEQEDVLRVHLLDRGEGIDILQEGQIATLVDTPVGLAIRTKQVVVTGLDYLTEFPSEVVRRAVSQGLRANCSVPLLRNNRVIGAMSIASKTESAFTQEDGELFMQIAGQVAIAVENALNFARAHAAEEEAKLQSQRRQLLLEINNAMVAQLDLRSLLQVISALLRRISRSDVVGLALYDPDANQLRAYAYDSLDKKFAIEEGTPIPLDSSLSGAAFAQGQPIFHNRIDEERFQSTFSQRFRAAGLKSGGVVPLIAHGRTLGTLSIASYREANLTKDEQELLCQIANQVALAVENALAFREIEALKNKLTSEKLYLEDEIRTQSNFEELIGESPTFRRILKQVETVAPTDSTVLIRGETGTGKELIARAIHHLSTRRERTLVKINCAAIPTGLLESELFGHEKGAFTGAIAQRIGRFELAHHGTLLLDEVGDIPLELQSKLLRVLQEQEFERLGSTRTQRVDVRLIAATNCDLEQMVAERKYRSDLFYRLNVFPITIPPLRQRREDIPALTRFFTQKYARRLKKPITAIPAEAMAALTAYHWPGNVRELEHFIERAVILTRGADLEISFAELKAAEPTPTTSTNLPTLETAEREHILRALEETNWVIGGPNGAAAKLGLKRTTLQSRMHKLGIAR